MLGALDKTRGCPPNYLQRKEANTADSRFLCAEAVVLKLMVREVEGKVVQNTVGDGDAVPDSKVVGQSGKIAD